MAITTGDFQAFLIASLADADPTALEGLQQNIPLYWTLHARCALPELRYLYVRRDAIRYLMACLTRQTDYQRRSQNASRQSVESGRQDRTLNGTMSEDSAALSDRAASSVYDDETVGTGTGTSAIARDSTQSSLDNSSFADTGAGASAAAQHTTQSASSSDSGSSSDASTWESSDTHTASSSRLYSNTMTQVSESGAIIVGSESGTHTDRSASDTSSSSDHRVGFRTTTYTMTQTETRSASGSQAGTQSSSSHFNAHAIQSSSGNSAASMTGSSSEHSSESVNGSGAGSGSSEGTGSSSLTASSARTGHSDGEAHRSSQALSQTTGAMERLHQRFLHLQDLWQRTSELIDWMEAQRLALSPYVVRQIVTQYPEGCNAQIANAFLVKTPLGGTLR